MLPEDLGTELVFHAADIALLVFTGIVTLFCFSFSGGSQSLLYSAVHL